MRHYVHVGHRQLPRRRPRGSTRTSASSPRDPAIAADVAELFNSLTGYARPRQLPQGAGRARRTCATPLLEEIAATVDAARAGEDARIVLKMNSLVDQPLHRRALRGVAAGA